MSVRASKKQKVESADALDDGLEYEVGSDSAGEAESIAPSDDESEDDVTSIAEEEKDNGEGSSKVEKVQKKRVSVEEKRAKRKLRKESTKARKKEEEGVEEGRSEVLSINQQVDLFARLVRDYAPPSLSSIELDDLTFSGSSFLDTTPFDRPRTLDSVLPFMRRFSDREKLEISNKEFGRPHTLFITSSAIRVADLCRALTGLKTTQASIAKLFGKEKASVQADFLGKNRVNVAVGVPARITALIDLAALKIDRVEQVILDTSYRDAKNRSLLTVKEVTRDLISLLTTHHDELGSRIKSGDCRIVLF